MSASQPTVRHDRARGHAGAAVNHNLSVPALYEAAIRRDEGLIADGGPLVVRTGSHTGRSPQDKFVVDERGSRDQVWWGPVNRPISEEHYEALRERVLGHLAKRETFVQDLFVGAHPAHRRSVRVTTESAWASLFAHNLFIRPSAAERSRLPGRLHDLRRPHARGGAGARRHPHGHVHPRPPDAAGDPHRRHGLCRRDQEERLHGHELPAAGRGRAADALGRQRGAGRRHGRLLRPVGHGQDDPRGRSGAHPDRRRRARLGPRRGLQLRGRLLRQDHPPVTDLRARHLLHDPPLRHDPGERGHGRGDARARPGLRGPDREHPRGLPRLVHLQRLRGRPRRPPHGRSSS